MPMIDTEHFESKILHIRQLRQNWSAAVNALPKDRESPGGSEEVTQLLEALRVAREAYYIACAELVGLLDHHVTTASDKL